MAITTVDPGKVVFELLTTSGTDLNGLVGSRVHPDDLPDDFDETTATLVYSLAGGNAGFKVPTITPRVVITIYGGAGSNESPSKAKVREVWRALHDIANGINNSSQSSGVIITSEEIITLQTLWDEDLHIPYGICSYQMQIRNT